MSENVEWEWSVVGSTAAGGVIAGNRCNARRKYKALTDLLRLDTVGLMRTDIIT